MLRSMLVSVVFVLIGLFGLLIAAGAVDISAQVMGFAMVALAWFLMVGYHGRRAEAEERARHRDGH